MNFECADPQEDAVRSSSMPFASQGTHDLESSAAIFSNYAAISEWHGLLQKQLYLAPQCHAQKMSGCGKWVIRICSLGIFLKRIGISNAYVE